MVSITAEAAQENHIEVPQSKHQNDNETKVLFIGNSYTSFNDLPHVFLSLAHKKGKRAIVKSYTMGGYKFEHHKKSMAALKAIESENWDYVVLQNQSQVPGLKPKHVVPKSLPNAIDLTKIIHANNASTQIVYFVTWGRKNGDAMNCRYYPKVCDFSGHTDALSQGYGIYQSSTGGVLAEVGQSWLTVINDISASDSFKELWNSDDSHPTYRGTYLAANTIYASIFNESTIGIEFYGSLKRIDAVYYQQIASRNIKKLLVYPEMN